jgi:hypothetical protein
MKKSLIRLLACAMAAIAVLMTNAAPAQAQVKGGGPYGDIDGYYTWEINGKGWTIYSQDGYSWVYDDYGHRTYLDAYGNKLDNVTAAAAKTITQYRLTYYSTVNGVTVYQNPDGKLYTVDSNGYLSQAGGSTPTPAPSVNDYTMTYIFTSPNGYNIYQDIHGNYWWFAAGGIPNRWTSGMPAGSYWKEGVGNYTYRFSYKSNEGYYIYVDDYGSTWWFSADGTPHQVTKGSGGGAGGFTPGVDYTRTNTLTVDGRSYVCYVGQYWTAPTTVSWTPAGKKLLGWDYAESTGYVRWKPGTSIKNTGNDLTLYAVYG